MAALLIGSKVMKATPTPPTGALTDAQAMLKMPMFYDPGLGNDVSRMRIYRSAYGSSEYHLIAELEPDEHGKFPATYTDNRRITDE